MEQHLPGCLVAHVIILATDPPTCLDPVITNWISDATEDTGNWRKKHSWKGGHYLLGISSVPAIGLGAENTCGFWKQDARGPDLPRGIRSQGTILEPALWASRLKLCKPPHILHLP